MKIALCIILFGALAQLARAGLSQILIPGNSPGPHMLTPQEQAAQVRMYQTLRRREQMLEAELLMHQQAQQAAEAARQQQIQSQLDELKQDADQKAEDVVSAETSLKTLMETILTNKKLIPKDPWRQVFGTKEYVKSSGSGFVKFDGSVLQIASNGILVGGHCGNVDTNFFVENFPYGNMYEEGDYLPMRNPYVALPDGFFTYVGIDGSIQSVPRLNYEKPCSPARNAHAIEAAAQNFTPDEKQEVESAKVKVEQIKAEAKSAAAQLRRFSQAIEAEREAAVQAKNAPVSRALKYNQALANKGDPYGLLRMGERYRDGDGVPKDFAKAREYLEKAEKAGDPTAAGELAELSQSPAVSHSSSSK